MNKLSLWMSAAVLAFAAAACSSDANSGNAFCDGYGTKLAGLKCKNGVDAANLADDCAMIVSADTKCANQYKAVLSCQESTSSCDSSGNISFGDCPTETAAYNACHGQ